jgi:Ni/Co efflux regulator RcnB
MRRTATAFAIAAASLVFGSLAHAQAWDRDGRGHLRHDSRAGVHADVRGADWRHRHGQAQRQDQGGRRHLEEHRRHLPAYAGRDRAYTHRGQLTHPRYHVQPGYVQPGYVQPGYGQRGYVQPGYVQPGYVYRVQPGYVNPGHQWSSPVYRRGDHLPYHLRQPHYHVSDWRAHRLYAPPHGYHWVRADNRGDYLLVAIATGLIANLLLNHY